MKQMTLNDIKDYELVVDNFAGGGGASAGIEMALGRTVDIAINHDPAAIAMHKANHPYTKHYCESVWEVNPYEVTKGKPVGLAWFSPDCKHFSKAKGGKPKDKNIRGLAWVAVKWASFVKPRVIMLENVEEFKTWGPLDEEGKVIPDRKGETFEHFIKALRENGYVVEHRELRACDYGAPTTRKRFFLIARSDGEKIIWKKPTHGDPKSIEVKNGILKPWRTATEIIDWSIPCPSIFNRKKPLAENTMKRIARGIKKFVYDNPKPFIVRIGQTGFGKDRLQYPLDKSLTTITAKAEHCLVTPFISTYHTETRENEVRGQEIDKPITTVDGSNRYALATAFIERQFKSSTGHAMNVPLGTVTTIDKSRLVEAFLIKYYGTDIGQDLQKPLHTVTSKDRFGLITIENEQYKIVDIGLRMLQPRELFNAQGFSPDYIINNDYKGNKYPKTAQVARCGNAVPPPLAKALVEANLPELIEYRAIS
ncbi:DNA cytosine methyltransferase [Vallitalea guaymasensis]|uniref:DNA cytosine methyltransferase n=1 Tax=Vallitalea guaymasensis TaxID=1185412 RepID=UPI00235607A4|nr:DNA cytosine methyltransferase [Vallitalea guaymasensis]